MLEATCISKTYGSIRANDCLTASINPGEIVGLLGENGAGKSTFLSILAGRIQPDSGYLQIDGQRVEISSPRDALHLGISIVFQHFALVPSFTVREQLRLAGWDAPQLPDLLASRLSGDEIIGQLSLGERQLVEIARARVSNPRFLLLDEPTSILTTAEAHGLFEVMRGLREDGTSVVLVTHKLQEAMAVCDRIVVLRRGRAVDGISRMSHGWPEGCENRLLRSMFGSLPGNDVPVPIPASAKRPQSDSSVRFHIQDVSTPAAHGRMGLHHIDLDIGDGEIVAVVGVDGQGQRELADVCAGYARISGIITLDGHVLPAGNAPAFRHAGVAYLTDDRIGEGAVPGFSIEANLAMKQQRDWPLSRLGILRRRAIRQYARDMIAAWNIEPPRANLPIDVLSGGNVQKVLLARELSIASSLLIVNKPSQGLDARTRDLVWNAIRQFAENRGAVLLLATDVDEALAFADRVAVIYEGRVSALSGTSDIARAELERMMVAGWS